MNYIVSNVVILEIFSEHSGLPKATRDEIARRIITEGTRFVASNSEAGSPRRVTARRVDGGIIVSGTKTFNTDSGGGGIASVGTPLEGEQGRWHALIPLDSEGVTCRHDWDVMGQRGTQSQTIDYDDVFVPDGWYCRSHGFSNPALLPYGFLTHAAIMLGPGYGAFDAACEYVRKLDRPSLPEFASAAADPLIRKRVGALAVDLEAARAFLLRTAARIEHWDDLGLDDTETMVQAFAVKVACVRAALNVTQEIFDLTGARSTSNKYRLDRFWRNARTFSTHDPTDAKEVWVGDWYLSGKEPPLVAMLRV